MNSHVVLDGELLAAAEAKISPLGEGFMYGLGLFETIKVLRGKPLFFRRHLQRLRRGADELGLAVAASDDELLTRCARCLAANGLREGSLKIVVFQGTSGPSQLIVARGATYSEADYERGFRLKTFPDRRGDGTGALKSLNYLKNLRARRTAAAAACDEALFVDSAGEVLEGSATNIFAVTPAAIVTPPLSAGILPGIARSIVLDLGADRPVREETISLERLRQAEEVFVTNALLGVMPVGAVDDRRWELRPDSITAGLLRAYRKKEADDGA